MSSANPPLPLAGLKVLDFSTLLPGPYATMLLADMGAQVLRVESPNRVDLVREMAPQVAGQSAAFQYLNRGKQSLGMDLKHPRAKPLIERLLADYDILVEQFRPGVMARLGLDYASLSALNPRLIYCSITGYGQSGPYRDRAGHDINYLALSGISDSSGNAAGPALCSVQIADIAAGSQPAVMAILAAVIQRQQTGQGQALDIAMLDQCLALQPLLMPGVLHQQPPVKPGGHFLNGAGIYDYYRTADERYLAVGSLEPVFRQRLLETLHKPQWQSLPDSALKPRLVELFKSRTQAQWLADFAEVDACVEPVLDMHEANHSPQAQARQMSQHGQIRATPLLAGMDPHQPPADAPLCGQDTDQVLLQLGLSRNEIAVLRQQGVCS